jgi:hypothetical protein
VKVGDLVRFCSDANNGALAHYRKKGIIVSFDADDDPIVAWFHPSFQGQPEPNFRSHIEMLSEC